MIIGTVENLNAQIGPGVTMVYFSAPWCGPCKMLAPTLNSLEDELDGLTVIKVNVDEEPELARDYNIMGIPTMMLFVDGDPVKTIVGVKTKATLLAEIEGLTDPAPVE